MTDKNFIDLVKFTAQRTAVRLIVLEQVLGRIAGAVSVGVGVGHDDAIFAWGSSGAGREGHDGGSKRNQAESTFRFLHKCGLVPPCTNDARKFYSLKRIGATGKLLIIAMMPKIIPKTMFFMGVCNIFTTLFVSSWKGF